MGFQLILRTLRRWRLRRNLFVTAVCLVLVLHLGLEAGSALPATDVPSQSASPSTSTTQAAIDLLPAPQSHPLPPSLMDWTANATAGDYFTDIQPTNLGYLVWSRFPVRVHLDPAIAPGDAAQANRSLVETWVNAVRGAVAEWNEVLPLELTDSPEDADITILRRTPPLTIQPGQPLQARSAETRYEFYADTQQQPPTLSHRFQIFLRSDQSADYVQAAARHELGHALGIWGHSSEQTDALYFSQVRTPASISPRDINTLQKIYQQPTRLGWAFPTTAMQ